MLANVYADALNAAGFQATVQTVGNRELYLPALERGEIQAFPEYLATVTDIINGNVNGPDAEPVATSDVDETRRGPTPLAEQSGLVFGEPAEATDQNAFAVTTGVRRRARRRPRCPSWPRPAATGRSPSAARAECPSGRSASWAWRRPTA